VQARLESTAYKYAWVNLDMLVEGDHLKVNVSGPWSRGSLIYDRKTSEIILVDDLNKIVLPVGESTQTGIEMMGYMVSAKLKDEAQGALPSVRLAYDMVEQNARALFNGTSVIQHKKVRMDGYLCDLYEAEAGNGQKRQVWLAPLEATGINRDDFDTLWSLAQRLLDVFGYELTQLGADTAPFLQERSDSTFPIHAALYSDGKISSRFKIIKISHPTLTSDMFNPPMGYQALSLLDLIRQGIKGKS